MNWLLVPIITVLGMVGGQWGKWLRRFGIPSTAITYNIIKDIQYKRIRWKKYFLGLLAFFLSIGYGENSILIKIFRLDWLVRIIYGILLSIPFFLVGSKYGIPAIIALPIAWSLRLGKFKIYKDYDFLWEDFVRYGTLGCIISYTIM